MKDIPIEKFGTKLMVSSKSINKIPSEYLRLSQNARIYDWWIWPRKWKDLLAESPLSTSNKGWFLLNSKLYAITNNRIYEIDKIDWSQTEIGDIWHWLYTDILTYWNSFAIIVAEWQYLKVFDWTAITTPSTVPTGKWWMIEYCRWYSFYAVDNVLHISRPITQANPEYAYDFTWEWSQNIVYPSKITWLKGTMNWLYIFTEEKVEFLWANSLQNVSWSATFISQPLWIWDGVINAKSIAASWDKIFYITKNLVLNTVNYIQWTDSAQIGELSMVPIVSFREFMKTLSHDQETWFAYYNQKDKSIQFWLRTEWFSYNNRILYYDMINQTYNIDTWKNYNYVVKDWEKYYWFSDINSNVYLDDTWYIDHWQAIPFKIQTQSMNQGTMQEKMYWWMFTSWWIWESTSLTYTVKVDWANVFQDTVTWSVQSSWLDESIWESGWDTIWWVATWWNPPWWEKLYQWSLIPFDKMADEWRIHQAWTRLQIEITSTSMIQDFLIDILWIRAEVMGNIDVNNKR